MLLGLYNLFISLVTVLQVQVVLLNRYALLLRRRRALYSVCLTETRKRRRFKPYMERRFWVRPGRTASWWDNFETQIVLPEEWRDNFRMSRGSLLRLSNILRPHIEGLTTRMREPVDVVKKVACTLYYLSDKGRMRKTANSFGLACQTVSKIVREVCTAITYHLGLEYITLPLTEPAVADLTSRFFP